MAVDGIPGSALASNGRWETRLLTGIRLHLDLALPIAKYERLIAGKELVSGFIS